MILNKDTFGMANFNNAKEAFEQIWKIDDQMITLTVRTISGLNCKCNCNSRSGGGQLFGPTGHIPHFFIMQATLL
jgi:hypothetical protein